MYWVTRWVTPQTWRKVGWLILGIFAPEMVSSSKTSFAMFMHGCILELPAPFLFVFSSYYAHPFLSDA